MPLIVNRRESGVPVRLKSGRQIVLLPGQTMEISEDDLSSFGVKSVLDAQHIAVLPSGSSQKNSVKTEKAKLEKVETQKAEAEEVKTENVEAKVSSSAANSKKSKEGKAS